jgi:hypothetical protein
MRSSFRNTPKIIFRMGSVQTIDEFIACSFDIFHCATSVFSSHNANILMIRALRAGTYYDVAAALRHEQFDIALSNLQQQRAHTTEENNL